MERALRKDCVEVRCEAETFFTERRSELEPVRAIVSNAWPLLAMKVRPIYKTLVQMGGKFDREVKKLRKDREELET